MNRARRSSLRREYEVFERFLSENNLKHSRQREIILGQFLETEGHLSVDELYQIIQRKHPEIGRTTIYRTLKLLCDAQLAEAIELKDGLTRFEHRYDHEHHDHMICTECGAIAEFANETIEKIQAEIAKARGFIMHSHRHQIFGICRRCSQSGRSKSARPKAEPRRKDAPPRETQSILP
jgi:Fur family ferric uptake transcriptional regulator